MNRHHAAIVLLTAAAVVLVVFFLFLLLFRVRDVEIVGNYHYTDDQIKEMMLKGPLSGNTVLISLTNKNKKVEGADFIDTVSVDMTGRNSIRIQVNEKQLIGYVSYSGAFWYFDADGRVLVRSDNPEKDSSAAAEAGSLASENETSVSGADSTSSASGASDASAGSFAETVTTESVMTAAQTSSDQSVGTGTVTPQEVTQDSESDQVVLQPDVVQDTSEESSGSGVEKSTKAEKDYIPYVEGLQFDEAAVGDILPVADASVFKTVASLKNIINKNDIQPDRVIFAEDGTLTLVYGQASVLLGKDVHLEAKLEELTGILPKMSGLSGTLHLENFDGSQNRIIFDKS